jgi:anti-anti-sigma factor
MVEFNFIEQDKILISVLNGRIGTDTCEEFAGRLSEKISECLNLITDGGNLKVCFDLKDVSFISSSFIRICMMTSQQFSAWNFTIINASPLIKKTYKIAGLDRALNVS